MTPIELSVAAAWRAASKELGVVVTAPAAAKIAQHLDVVVPVLVHHFGRESGALVLVIGEPSEALRPVLGATNFVSAVAASYATYERDLFVDTLNDWGFFGPPELRPSWYTGAAWS
jgi:hypothetical protein